MTILELKQEIERIISRSPYSKEEILSLFTLEEDKFEPDEILAYGVALDYLKDKKSADYKKLEKLFRTRKDKLIKKYL